MDVRQTPTVQSAFDSSEGSPNSELQNPDPLGPGAEVGTPCAQEIRPPLRRSMGISEQCRLTVRQVKAAARRREQTPR